MTSQWQPTPRLDAARLVRRLAELTGVRLVVEGPCRGGEVGASYVRWPDGRRSVLSQGQASAAELVTIACRAGVPAPRYELTADVDGVTVVVQQLLPGVPPATVDERLVAQLIALNARLAALLVDRPDLPPVPLYLRGSGPGFCHHETLAGYDRRTARLLGWIRAVGAERDTADGIDLVHLDFHASNILVDNGQISGLVDWGGGRGDRYFDLVTLRFDLALRAPRLIPALDEMLAAAVPADRLRAYHAHMSLRLVDWAIRHHSAAAVELWLSTAEAVASRA